MRGVHAGVSAAALVLVMTAAPSSSTAATPAAASGRPSQTVLIYDDFEDADGYTASDYAAKWANPYGPGEMAAGATQQFTGGAFTADATPFRTWSDTSVFDHLKYLGVSTQTFPVPTRGSITFSMTITAQSPGTRAGRLVHGTYTSSGAPFVQQVRQGQQAAAAMNVIDFSTGQLFDWFISGDSALAIVERLPATVTGTPAGATRETMYTQIVQEVPLKPGKAHQVAITYERGAQGSSATWYLDGKRITHVKSVGVPLDVQHAPYTGAYPSLGEGEVLADQINSLSLGHGLFSLLDAFPYQHPDAPELSVSVPEEQRIFGQGVRASFDDARVTTVSR